MIFLALSSCGPRIVIRCPVEVPSAWRKPGYEHMKTGFVITENRITISQEDAKLILKNQIMCEEIRRGLINLIDDSTTLK